MRQRLRCLPQRHAFFQFSVALVCFSTHSSCLNHLSLHLAHTLPHLASRMQQCIWLWPPRKGRACVAPSTLVCHPHPATLNSLSQHQLPSLSCHMASSPLPLLVVILVDHCAFPRFKHHKNKCKQARGECSKGQAGRTEGLSKRRYDTSEPEQQHRMRRALCAAC